MKLAVLFILSLFISMTYSGPIAFGTCLKAFGAYTAGCGAALATCATSLPFPPAYLACVTAAMGVTGAIFIGFCTAALMAPTP